MFDIFWKPKPLTKYPAYLGHTVHQSQYDEKVEEVCDLSAKLGQIRMYLEPFASVGSTLRGRTTDSTVELAAQAHDLLKAGSATMKQQAREIEQLTEQLDDVTHKLEHAHQSIRDQHRLIARAEEQITQLQQQQIMLTTTTPGNVKPVPGAMPGTYTMNALTTTPTRKRKPRETGAKP